MANKANHQANIVRVTDMREHNNADSLELIYIDGYQVVVRKGQFAVGELAVYIAPDSVVPQTEPFRFIWGEYALAETAEPSATDPLGLGSQVPERRRRITVRKFRGEWSEGLLLPLTDFPGLEVLLGIPIDAWEDIDAWEGLDVSGALGIIHYEADDGLGLKDTYSWEGRRHGEHDDN